MRILIVSDAWSPQVNGVVVTLRATIACLERMGHEVRVLSPEGFRTVPMPTYPEIRLAVLPGRAVARCIDEWSPDTIHIATEGPLGVAARNHCVRRRLSFTTAYHTCFPEYVQARFGIPLPVTYAFMRWMHRPAAGVMVATASLRDTLQQQGIERLVHWSRGVDIDLFRPIDGAWNYPRPVFLSVGRIAVEKNLPAFLSLDLPGTKLVVGEGPQRAELMRRFPDAVFLGGRPIEVLVHCYQRADVFVFPSRTDTFGLVMLEAMACGTPVAAYPVTGPRDVVTDPAAGVLDEELGTAAMAALRLDRTAVRRHAERYSWERCTAEFLTELVPARTAGVIVGQPG
jgi:glycosyltransferase involved in cell wall biosynthesis